VQCALRCAVIKSGSISNVFVMPGLDPGIYVFFSGLFKDVDGGRDKPGHDRQLPDAAVRPGHEG